MHFAKSPKTAQPHRVLFRSLLVLTAVLALSFGVAAAAPDSVSPKPVARAAKQPIVFGASGGKELAKLARKIHAPLAGHVFARLKGTVKQGRLITMAPSYKWRVIASARPGSPAYRNLVRWAKALKARTGRPILFTFSHEPEGSSSDGLGNNKQFIAAWRRVHDVFAAQGVRNVEYTWNMTSNAFRVSPRDNRAAGKWYPGDRYVDNVATAAYNWHNCGEGTGKWLSLRSRAAAPLAYARIHHKKYVLAEWASQRGARRAGWLAAARKWFLQNHNSIRGAFYYQSPRPRAGCFWRLYAPKELSAFARMARDRRNFGG